MTESAQPGVCARCGRSGARPCAVYAAVAQGELCPSCEREVHRLVWGALGAPGA